MPCVTGSLSGRGRQDRGVQKPQIFFYPVEDWQCGEEERARERERERERRAREREGERERARFFSTTNKLRICEICTRTHTYTHTHTHTHNTHTKHARAPSQTPWEWEQRRGEREPLRQKTTTTVIDRPERKIQKERERSLRPSYKSSRKICSANLHDNLNSKSDFNEFKLPQFKTEQKEWFKLQFSAI